jgi:CBS domain-containing protein
MHAYDRIAVWCPRALSAPPRRAVSTYAASDKNMFDNLSNARICDWAEYKKQRGTSINRLLCISPEATLHEAVRQLLNYRVHRLCVVQLALADTVLRIITNHGILRFLRNNVPTELSSRLSVRELGIGVFHNLLTLTFTTPVIKALELLSAYKVSSIPIVDENNHPLDVYSRADVRYLALDQTWTNLDMTIEEALAKHRVSAELERGAGTIQCLAGECLTVAAQRGALSLTLYARRSLRLYAVLSLCLSLFAAWSRSSAVLARRQHPHDLGSSR